MRTQLESYDDRFDRLIAPGAQLKRLFSGTAWAEGPAYVKADRALVWSDVPNNRMYRWTPEQGGSVFRAPSNYSNGNTVDRSGRLVTCEHLTHRISRTEPDGTIVPLVDNYRGKRFNSPNDLVVKSDDSIWFTDPPYGILSNYEGVQQVSAVGGNFVYRFDPATGDLSIVADDFDKPNGLAFSPDESVLYVADTGGTHTPNGPHHIRAFDVSASSQLSNSRVFAEVSRASRMDSGSTRPETYSRAHSTGYRCTRPTGCCWGRSSYRNGLRPTAPLAAMTIRPCSSPRPPRYTQLKRLPGAPFPRNGIYGMPPLQSPAIISFEWATSRGVGRAER